MFLYRYRHQHNYEYEIRKKRTMNVPHDQDHESIALNVSSMKEIVRLALRTSLHDRARNVERWLENTHGHNYVRAVNQETFKEIFALKAEMVKRYPDHLNRFALREEIRKLNVVKGPGIIRANASPRFSSLVAPNTNHVRSFVGQTPQYQQHRPSTPHVRQRRPSTPPNPQEKRFETDPQAAAIKARQNALENEHSVDAENERRKLAAHQQNVYWGIPNPYQGYPNNNHPIYQAARPAPNFQQKQYQKQQKQLYQQNYHLNNRTVYGANPLASPGRMARPNMAHMKPNVAHGPKVDPAPQRRGSNVRFAQNPVTMEVNPSLENPGSNPGVRVQGRRGSWSGYRGNNGYQNGGGMGTSAYDRSSMRY